MPLKIARFSLFIFNLKKLVNSLYTDLYTTSINLADVTVPEKLKFLFFGLKSKCYVLRLLYFCVDRGCEASLGVGRCRAIPGSPCCGVWPVHTSEACRTGKQQQSKSLWNWLNFMTYMSDHREIKTFDQKKNTIYLTDPLLRQRHLTT